MTVIVATDTNTLSVTANDDVARHAQASGPGKGKGTRDARVRCGLARFRANSSAPVESIERDYERLVRLSRDAFRAILTNKAADRTKETGKDPRAEHVLGVSEGWRRAIESFD